MTDKKWICNICNKPVLHFQKDENFNLVNMPLYFYRTESKIVVYCGPDCATKHLSKVIYANRS